MNKKVVIDRVAFIKKCGCGLHGHIKFPDGSCSYEFYSRVDGLEMIRESVRGGFMRDDEADVLREEFKQWKFFDDRFLPQLRDVVNTLQTTGHPPEIIEEILMMIYDIGNQLFSEYSPKDITFGDEETAPESRRPLDS